MPHSAWFAVTSLGGAGLMLPAAAVISGQLIAARAWRIAFWWMLSFATAVGLVLASKVAFLGWGIGIRSLDFTGVSGHTMLATAVLPVLAYLLFPRKQRGVFTLGIVCSLALSSAVGVSRWVLGMHTPAEVVFGFGIGALVAAGFIRFAGQREKLVMHAWAMAALLILVAAFHNGYDNQATAHDFVVKIALYASGRDRPYSRAEWQLGDEGLHTF